MLLLPKQRRGLDERERRRTRRSNPLERPPRGLRPSALRLRNDFRHGGRVPLQVLHGHAPSRTCLRRLDLSDRPLLGWSHRPHHGIHLGCHPIAHGTTAPVLPGERDPRRHRLLLSLDSARRPEGLGPVSPPDRGLPGHLHLLDGLLHPPQLAGSGADHGLPRAHPSHRGQRRAGVPGGAGRNAGAAAVRRPVRKREQGVLLSGRHDGRPHRPLHVHLLLQREGESRIPAAKPHRHSGKA